MMAKESILLLVITLFSITASAQKVSPVQSPLSPPQGMNTAPLVPASPAGAPIAATTTIDILQILTKAKRFSILIRLLKTTQLINQLNSQLFTSSSSGLTLFAPEDNAFSNLKPGFLNSLDDRQKVELLQFHTLSSFISISNFDTLTNPVQTQAGDDSLRLQLNVTTYGGNRVSMATGAVNATVTGTVYTDNKLAVYEVSKVLVPLDFVLPKAKAPSPAKGISPGSSAGESGKSGSGDDVIPVDSGCVSLKVEKVMWMPIVLVLVVGVMM
ncbi:fasciclin-like arabinogalactan protein 11 isoform X2 [Cajanus cajan]|uniref:fasciclin-like arabinogalactan protein 11 isoform X1 n=1 Tax=Cajanus cajan TaxID=3821 RepID=UPI0010FB0C83|nr:fasciclin-like arabinogalactan protein 11 isoform X1 [Cajanus cajan]XP_029124813.1 fasciclin-like arabinogalactan protein 11 isoform X2 [Cajanus cajan]